MRTLASGGRVLTILPVALLMASVQSVPPITRDSPAQALPKRTATLSGRVTAAATGQPMKLVDVRVTSEGRQAGFAFTDAAGRYRVADLAAGSYKVTFRKPGYIAQQFGQRRGSAGTEIRVRDGQVVESINVALTRGGAIEGRVVDENSEPVIEATVTPMRLTYSGGSRRLVPAGRPVTTNDLGNYRIYGLSSGEYAVSATVRGYGSTYHPSTVRADFAQRVRVTAGQDVPSIDVGLQPTAGARVQGTLTTSEGPPGGGGWSFVMLAPSRASELTAAAVGGTSHSSKMDADGNFTFTGVPPGIYKLQARATPASRTAGEDGKPTELFVQTITLGGEDVSGLVVRTTPGGAVAGVVRAPAGSAVPSSARISVLAVGDGDYLPGGDPTLDDQKRFTLSGLFGTWVLRISGLPDGLQLDTVLAGGQDVTDIGIALGQQREPVEVEVILTSATELTGRVVDDKAQPVANYTAIVFADNQELWRLPSTRYVDATPGTAERFRITRLPPGRYRAIAVEHVEPGQWLDPAYLMSLSRRATSLEIRAGSPATVSLTISRQP